MDTRPCYVYALADSTGVRYIGRSMSPRTRLTAHKVGQDKHLTSFLDYSDVRLLIIEATTQDEADEREAFWIAALCRREPILNIVGNPNLRWKRPNGPCAPWLLERIDNGMPHASQWV